MSEALGSCEGTTWGALAVAYSVKEVLGSCERNVRMDAHLHKVLASYNKAVKEVLTHTRYGEIASAILNFFVCCMEMG